MSHHRPVRPVSITLRPPTPLTAVALLLGAVPFALHAWLALHGFFAHDDFLLTIRAADGGPFDLAFLFQDYNGHIAPGTFLLAWVVTAIAPLNFPVAMAPLLLMQAATLVVFWRLLTRCFGHRWVLLLPFAVFACSPTILAPTMWWAFAEQLAPLLLAMVCALAAHTKFVLDGRYRHVLAALLWTVFGLAFAEKAALIPVLLFGVTVLMSARRGWSALRDAVRGRWPAWLAYGVLTAVFGGLFLSATSTEVDATVSASAVAGLARNMVLHSLFAPTVGLPVTNAAGATTPVLAVPPGWVGVLASVLAMLLVVAGLVVGRWRAAQAFLLLAGYLAVDVALVAVARLPLISALVDPGVGALIGFDPRYIADAVPVLVLCLAFAFLRPVTAESTPEQPTPVAPTPDVAPVAESEVDEPAEPAEPAEPVERHRMPRVLVGLTAVVTVALAVSATVTMVRWSNALTFKESRAYVATARAALAENPDTVIYDAGVPDEVMVSWFGPEAVTSHVIGLLPGPPRFDQQTAEITMLDGHGRPRRVDGVLNAVTNLPAPVPDCGYPVSDGLTVIPLNGFVGGRRLVRLEYYTQFPGQAVLNAGDASFTIDLQAGVHLLQLVTTSTYGRIDIKRSAAVGTACFVRVIVGEPLVQ